MLPSNLVTQLEKGIGDYIKTTFPMTNVLFKCSIQKKVEIKDSVYCKPSAQLSCRVAPFDRCDQEQDYKTTGSSLRRNTEVHNERTCI